MEASLARTCRRANGSDQQRDPVLEEPQCRLRLVGGQRCLSGFWLLEQSLISIAEKKMCSDICIRISGKGKKMNKMKCDLNTDIQRFRTATEHMMVYDCSKQVSFSWCPKHARASLFPVNQSCTMPALPHD